jgi:hypothetical protein
MGAAWGGGDGGGGAYTTSTGGRGKASTGLAGFTCGGARASSECGTEMEIIAGRIGIGGRCFGSRGLVVSASLCRLAREKLR